MAKLARKGARNLNVSRYAVELVRGSGFDTGLRSVFRYRPEQEEVVRDPEWMVSDIRSKGYCEGDCDDIATLCCALLCSLGIESRLTAIQTVSNEEYDHVFSEAYTETGWTPIDITVEPGTSYTCFGVLHEAI